MTGYPVRPSTSVGHSFIPLCRFLFVFCFRFLSLFTHTINQETRRHASEQTHVFTTRRGRGRGQGRSFKRASRQRTHLFVRSFVQSSQHRREGIYPAGVSVHSIRFNSFSNSSVEHSLLTVYSFNADDVNDGKNDGGDGDGGDDIFCVRVDDAKVRVITRDWVLRTSGGWFVERGVRERGRRRRRTRESIGGGLRRRQRPGYESTTSKRRWL